MLSLIGFDLEEVYGSDNDYLPIPSLFVVSADGKITHRSFNPDYRKRTDINDILDLH